MLSNVMVLLLLLAIAPLPAESYCEPGHTSVTIHVTAEFFQRSLSRAPSSQKTTEYSRQFLSKYEDYYNSLRKPYAGTQKDGSPIPVSQSYQPFSAYVFARIRLVAGTASSQASTDSDTVVGPPVGSIVTVTEIDTERLRRTESTLTNEYHPGFLQMVRKMTYYVNIGGMEATLEDETLVSSIPIGSSINLIDLNNMGKSYILEHYGEAGGEIVVNSFTQTKCFSTLTMEETDRLTSLEEKMLDIETKQESNSKSLTSLEDTVTTHDAEHDAEITTVKASLVTQDAEITTVKASLVTQDTELTTVKASLVTQDTELTTLSTTLTHHNTAITRQNDKISALERKQTRIVQAPQGLGSADCLVTCTGSTGPGTTAWSGSGGYVTTTVSMSGCGFVTTPVVTANVEGRGTGYNIYMTESIFRATSNKFELFMFGWVYTSRTPTGTWSDKPGTSHAASGMFNVMWHATGYVC